MSIVALAHFKIRGGFDGAPAILKLDGIALGEVSFGIALQCERCRAEQRHGETGKAEALGRREGLITER